MASKVIIGSLPSCLLGLHIWRLHLQDFWIFTCGTSHHYYSSFLRNRNHRKWAQKTKDAWTWLSAPRAVKFRVTPIQELRFEESIQWAFLQDNCELSSPFLGNQFILKSPLRRWISYAGQKNWTFCGQKSIFPTYTYVVVVSFQRSWKKEL